MLTLWVRERWALSGLQTAVFICCAVRLGWLALKKQPVAPGLSLILVAICLWGVLQLAEHWTVAPYDTANATLYWLSAACLVWLGQQACAAKEERHLFLKGALVLGAAIAFAGVVQLFTSGGRVFWLFPSGYSASVIGPFIDYSHFACFVELLLPIALVLAFEDQRYFLVAAGLLAAVVASTSRTGTILAIGETAVVFLLRGRNGLAHGRWVKLLILAAAFGSILSYQFLWNRFSNDPHPLLVRSAYLQSSLAMVRAQPLHGFGLGAWPSAYRAFAVIDTGNAADHANNEWIEWAAEGGLPVAAAMGLIFILCLPAATRSVWGVGVVTVFVHSLVDYPFVCLGLGAWIFVLIGALWSYARDPCSPETLNPVPRHSPWLTPLMVAPAIPVLAFGAFVTVRLAWADTLYRRGTPASIERASVLFPGNAEYHFALAQLEPQRAASELERCLTINPFLTNARIELAALVEDRGDLKQASAILLEAARRDTQFAPAWALVNFYFRNRQTEPFWHWARIAADMAYCDLRPLFDLCFLVANDAQIVRDRAVPPKRPVEIQFLRYLTSHQRLSDAELVARQIAENPRPADPETLLNYIDQSLTATRFAVARQIWDAMSSSGVGLAQGDSRPILNHGFDRHLPAVAGVVTAQPDQNEPELKVEFSGKQPQTCEILSQILSLQPGEKYALQFEYRTVGLPSQTGVSWSLGSNREFALVGSALWAFTEWRFSASADAGRLSLGYRRIPGTTRSAGILTLRRIRVTKVA